MVAIHPEILSKGIYTVPDAARLSRVSSRRIRYWLKDMGSEEENEPVHNRLWQGQHQPIDDKLALGFYDLQEVRFIDAFLKAGVSWHTLRMTHDVARSRYLTEHPFCIRQFVTDGKYILELLEQQSPAGVKYEEILHSQRVFSAVVEPFLKELEFSPNSRLLRWWPLGMDRQVVLDPQCQFGQPVTALDNISTEVLFQAVQAEQSIDDVAGWFEVDRRSVQDAVDFEQSLRA